MLSLAFFQGALFNVIDCNVRNAIYVLYADIRCSKMNCKLHHEMSLEEKWIFILSNNFKLSSMQKKKSLNESEEKEFQDFFSISYAQQK